jgi:lipid A 3-O-deacylase
MKKFVSFIFAALISVSGYASENPIFGDAQNQISVKASIGTGGSSMYNLLGIRWKMEPFSFFSVEYSQPITFFRLPARQNIEIGTTYGFDKRDGEDWSHYSWPIIGLSMDPVLLHTERCYAGVGVGPYIKWQVDSRQDSRFVFGTKVFMGCRVNNSFGVELFTKHFSNGNLTPINAAYNFVGLDVNVNF